MKALNINGNGISLGLNSIYLCLSAPVELFTSVGMKVSIEIQMGIENLLFPVQRFKWGWFWSAILPSKFQYGDEIIGQFPSGVGILGYFSTGKTVSMDEVFYGTSV